VANLLNITPVLDKIQEHRINWLQHGNRMPSDRLPRAIDSCRPSGRRNQGRTLKRFLDV
jgi:hypothetical protein